MIKQQFGIGSAKDSCSRDYKKWIFLKKEEKNRGKKNQMEPAVHQWVKGERRKRKKKKEKKIINIFN